MTSKVFIIDKVNMVRENISALLTLNNEVSVIGSTASYSKRENGISLSDILLMGHDQETPQALSLVCEIHRQHPKVKILLLSDRAETPVFLNQMLKAGVSGYITKNGNYDELAYGIKKVAENRIFICTNFILKFITQFPEFLKEGNQADPSIGLTVGESAVLHLISEGLTNTGMANKLCVSVRTIESRRKKLLDKTHTTNTATLIKFSVKAGLIN